MQEENEALQQLVMEITGDESDAQQKIAGLRDRYNDLVNEVSFDISSSSSRPHPPSASLSIPLLLALHIGNEDNVNAWLSRNRVDSFEFYRYCYKHVRFRHNRLS